MHCARCGIKITVGWNRARRLGRDYIVCQSCGHALAEQHARWMAVAVFVAAGIAAALVLAAGCSAPSPTPGLRPWQGPGPWGRPSWTNEVHDGTEDGRRKTEEENAEHRTSNIEHRTGTAEAETGNAERGTWNDAEVGR
jgi:hypothetical protein